MHAPVVQVVPPHFRPVAPAVLEAAIFFLAICALIRIGAVAAWRVVGVLTRVPLGSSP
ncbi:MAG: hypothetical protein KatS3mg012_2491 [Gaiellaceae bacterium]|nr:MAG: hypothetical protein KatS3mg012_2491 [Gaiellaceae bacterium]